MLLFARILAIDLARADNSISTTAALIPPRLAAAVLPMAQAARAASAAEGVAKPIPLMIFLLFFFLDFVKFFGSSVA